MVPHHSDPSDLLRSAIIPMSDPLSASGFSCVENFARRANIFSISSLAVASPVNPKPRIPSLLRQRGRVQFPAGTLKRRVARNVAVATSRASGAQHLAAWLQPADGDHKSPLAANGDLKFARRAKILTTTIKDGQECPSYMFIAGFQRASSIPPRPDQPTQVVSTA
jgi:hypothetical protein